MKCCPECRRDYLDDSLMYCLEDGTALVQGSVPSPDEQQTAILDTNVDRSEAVTRAQLHYSWRRSQDIERPYHTPAVGGGGIGGHPSDPRFAELVKRTNLPE